jgi:hypothetical protein
VFKVLVAKPEGKGPLGRPMHRWENGIRMNLRDVGLGGGQWIQLAQDRKRWQAFVNTSGLWLHGVSEEVDGPIK